MPIDAVYLWIDGSAPGTRARLSAALAEHSPDVSDEAARRRFRDHDELRYSLRSLQQHAPWIRRVHIVTDSDGSADYGFAQLTPNPFKTMADLGYVERVRPRFFCVNDDLGSGALSDRLGLCLREMLARMYPAPSRYERPQ